MVNRIREDNKKQSPVYHRIGDVISVAPLQVNVRGAIQEGDALLKNDAIIKFEKGDRLLLMPIDDEQRYIIICKVVDA